MNLKIKDFSKIIESNESIYKKIIAYKFRGTLYLDEELFIESSGEEFGFIPCLNGSTKFIALIEDLVTNSNKYNIDFRSLF